MVHFLLHCTCPGQKFKNYENGGCKMIDLNDMIKSQEVKFTKHFLSYDCAL